MQTTYLAIQGGLFSGRNVNITNKSLHIYFPSYFNLSQHLLITKLSNVIHHSTYVMKLISNWVLLIIQGKFEGFDSCDWPIIFFYSNWLQIVDFSARTTLKFAEWRQKQWAALLCYIKLSKAIGEFKLELQSRNGKLRSKLASFSYFLTLKFDRWPWNVIGHLSYAT